MQNPVEQCRQAIVHLSSLAEVDLVKISSFYKSPPLTLEGYEPQSQSWFINGVIEVQTLWEPLALLKELQAIEKKMGRSRKTKWGPRIIDLDLLFYGQQILSLPNLILPHPELAKRSFVMEPLKEIAPEFKHPLYKKSIDELSKKIENKCPLYVTGFLDERLQFQLHEERLAC